MGAAMSSSRGSRTMSVKVFRGLLDGRWNGDAKCLAFYLPTGGPDDLKNARRTVNVTDHWEEIAGFYRQFMAALDAARL